MRAQQPRSLPCTTQHLPTPPSQPAPPHMCRHPARAGVSWEPPTDTYITRRVRSAHGRRIAERTRHAGDTCLCDSSSILPTTSRTRHIPHIQHKETQPCTYTPSIYHQRATRGATACDSCAYAVRCEGKPSQTTTTAGPGRASRLSPGSPPVPRCADPSHDRRPLPSHPRLRHHLRPSLHLE